MRFIRRNQVQQITGLSRSSIYAMVADGTFPKQIKIGRRAVAWLETEIDDWMHERISKL
jgi:prophage regulatory protein